MAFSEIDKQLAAAHDAQQEIAKYSQNQIDNVVRALAWAIYRQDHARTLAEMAVADTGLGNIEDKILKNRRKTFGTLCDLLATPTVGKIFEDPERGITEWAKPVGVIGSLTPSTNPAATPANQALMAVKGGNSIIISPSPAGLRTAQKLKSYFDDALRAIGAPTELFQVLHAPISFDKADYLARNVDLLLVTGDQTNVRRGYSSGTPCIGVGKGNVPVIVDETADIKDAAAKIVASKTFDNATSCSSENSVILLESVYETMISELETAGGYLATPTEVGRIEEKLFTNGAVNRQAVGKDISTLQKLFEMKLPNSKRFILVPQSQIGKEAPLSGEKLALVLSVYKAKDFDGAIDICNDILDYEGAGHSVGIHTARKERSVALAEKVDVARVLVNQAHTFGNGGGMNNALPFTLTMGCGTWGKNSISENLSIKHFVNKTVLVETYEKEMPSPDEAFGTVYDPQFDPV